MNYATESIYLFCIYFSLNNFNYPNKKLAIPSKLRTSSTELPQLSREKKTSWVLGAVHESPDLLLPGTFLIRKIEEKKKSLVISGNPVKNYLGNYFCCSEFYNARENMSNLEEGKCTSTFNVKPL